MGAFLSTVIGSMPKPRWLYRLDRLDDGERDHHGAGGNWTLEEADLREAQDDAVRIAVHDQELAGIDIISDGEQRPKTR